MADNKEVRKGGRLRPPINITIAASILRRVDAAAKKAGQSRSIWIQIACAERLERESMSMNNKRSSSLFPWRHLIRKYVDDDVDE